MATIQSGLSTDILTIDPISKAARVTLYNPDGVLSEPAVRASYLAYSGSFGLAATATDVFSITGSSTKLVKVFRAAIVSVQTSAGINAWTLLKRSTANTGGTSSAIAAIRNDQNDTTPTATVLQYSANPTLGALVGKAWSGFIGSPAQPAPAGNPPGLAGLVGIEIDFIELFGKPLYLRSAADVLAWNFEGAAVPAGLSVRCGFRFTEE